MIQAEKPSKSSLRKHQAVLSAAFTASDAESLARLLDANQVSHPGALPLFELEQIIATGIDALGARVPLPDVCEWIELLCAVILAWFAISVVCLRHSKRCKLLCQCCHLILV